MDSHLYALKPPHRPLLQIIYNQSHVLQFICTHPFLQQHYPPHKSTPPPLSDAEPPTKNPSLSNPYSVFVFLPPQVMIITPVLILLLFKSLPVLLPIIRYTEILLSFKVWVCLVHHLFLYYIIWYIINKTKTIKYRQIHSFFDIPPHSKIWSPFVVNHLSCPLLVFQI